MVCKHYLSYYYKVTQKSMHHFFLSLLYTDQLSKFVFSSTLKKFCDKTVTENFTLMTVLSEVFHMQNVPVKRNVKTDRYSKYGQKFRAMFFDSKCTMITRMSDDL